MYKVRVYPIQLGRAYSSLHYFQFSFLSSIKLHSSAIDSVAITFLYVGTWYRAISQFIKDGIINNNQYKSTRFRITISYY